MKNVYKYWLTIFYKFQKILTNMHLSNGLQIPKRRQGIKSLHLSNLYPCNRVSARIVFVDVAKQPNKAAQNPNALKLSSVTDVRRIPPTMGIREAQIRQSKYFLQTSHCKTTAEVHQNQMKMSFKIQITT